MCFCTFYLLGAVKRSQILERVFQGHVTICDTLKYGFELNNNNNN